jgi:hypothetical protein
MRFGLANLGGLASVETSSDAVALDVLGGGL